MSKHTRGPWTVDLETGEIEAQGAVIGTIYGADDYPCCEEDIDEECKANARLIAAAPDMLQALWSVLGWAGDLVPDSVEQEALDAVVKATGETLRKPDDNKHLLNAAPDLLAACEALLAEHNNSFKDREHMRSQYYAAHPFREIAYNKARAAVAKARGESTNE